MDIITDAFGDPQLVQDVLKLRQDLIDHPIYQRVATQEDLRIYMKHHVFAVWDFMSLLKRLQQDLTTVEIPWTPKPNSEFTRFINEIVLDEESDQDSQGAYASHFTLYRQAMTEIGADDRPIQTLLALVAQQTPVVEALAAVPVAETTAQFVRQTMVIAQHGATHEVAAAFFYGREDIIPDMFRRMVDDSSADSSSPRFVYYLRRHIELDGDQHGPLAQRLLQSLCQTSDHRWNEALRAARKALTARIQLWNGIVSEMEAAR